MVHATILSRPDPDPIVRIELVLKRSEAKHLLNFFTPYARTTMDSIRDEYHNAVMGAFERC